MGLWIAVVKREGKTAMWLDSSGTKGRISHFTHIVLAIE